MKKRIETESGAWEIDTDPARLDFELVHGFLSRDSYWAQEIPAELQRKAIANSLCFGMYEASSGAQVAFCRFVTDRATFGWLSDVFVVDSERGKGLSKILVGEALAHPDLQGFRRMLLGTRDAHSLYEQYGFKPLAKPDLYMEIWRPKIYSER